MKLAVNQLVAPATVPSWLGSPLLCHAVTTFIYAYRIDNGYSYLVDYIVVLVRSLCLALALITDVQIG